MQLVWHGTTTESWNQIVPEVRWMGLAYLSGFISVGILAPSFVRKIILITSPDTLRSRHGVSFGALAGVLNVMVFASIHLALLAYGGITTGNLNGVKPIISLLLTYLPIAVLVMALPAAIIGALVGFATEISLRKFHV